jgi:hypothetical protein
VLAVSFVWGGTPIDVPGVWLAVFLGLVAACVIVPLWFNRSPNHDGDFVDERWGYGEVDDDTWGLPDSMR